MIDQIVSEMFGWPKYKRVRDALDDMARSGITAQRFWEIAEIRQRSSWLWRYVCYRYLLMKQEADDA